MENQELERATQNLERAVREGVIASAVLHVTEGNRSANRSFGKARDENAMFLLGSISKPVNVTALMTLFDRGEFKLDDSLQKFLPQFTGGGREQVTLRHLLTHTCGLPDQLRKNSELRRQHASLSEFADHALRTPLQFAPGSRYQYSSMGILLAARVAEHVSGLEIRELADRTVFQPLKMQHSAQGLGRFQLDEMVPVQTEHAAPEAGGGDPKAKDWDWNSAWWRQLGAPWGGTHASAPDIAKFLAEFLEGRGACVKPETARLMTRNHNPAGITARGLGFALGLLAGCRGGSERVFGHTGSTGTIAWAKPDSGRICVVLTSLPSAAVKPHPGEVAANAFAG